MRIAGKLIEAIDKSWVDDEEPRTYLGASQIGKKCSRELWYQFRWADKPEFESRVLRLFQRGHREEGVFEDILLRAGVLYWPHNPATGEQFVVTFQNKHIGGHTDGQGKGLPDLDPEDLFLGEFKTHNDRSFKELVAKGLQQAKPIHYTQMQLYMNRQCIHWGLYGAVNKDDDTLYFELIEADPQHVEYQLRRADMVVGAHTPPERINNNPGWYECKWCDFYSICHKAQPVDVNCRTCVHSRPLVSGEWWCGYHDKVLQFSEQLAGCSDHVAIGE